MLASPLDYLNENGVAFSFLATLVLVLVTVAYVVLTGRLARAQQEATRLQSEPVVVATPVKTQEGWGLKLRNASNALAIGIKVAGNGLYVIGPDECPALSAGEEAVFEFDTPQGAAERHLAKLDAEMAADLRSAEPLLDNRWGSFDVLHSDAYDSTLIRTRISLMQGRNPLTDELIEDWFAYTEVARERHSRKSLQSQANRRMERSTRSVNASATSAELWLQLHPDEE